MKRSCLTLLLFLGTAQLFAQSFFSATERGELVLRALGNSFPGKISAIAFIENDWTITAGGEVFFWAGGRLLPRAELGNRDSFGSYAFCPVPDRVTPPDSYSPQFIEGLRQRTSDAARRERRDNHRGFHGILYGGLTRQEVERQIVSVTFLGRTVRVHRDITRALERVEAAIRGQDGGPAFISSLGNITGFSWRSIPGTQRMSYHSWGLAIDILPRNLGGKAIYWMWERGHNADWMLLPLERRWSPPEAVIAAFEKEGFIWGGKWPMFDNMHFEYRPELHELTRLLKAAEARRP